MKTQSLFIAFLFTFLISFSLQSCKSHEEMLDLPVGEINLADKSDGIYNGEFKQSRWFYEVEVDVKSNRIDTILVIKSANNDDKFDKQLISRVIEKQSLQVDAVSGATITSKSFLKAVENALSDIE